MRSRCQLSVVNRNRFQRMVILLVGLLALWGVTDGAMRGPHHPRGHYHHQPRSDTKLTQDTQLLRDVQHIEEDLGQWGMSREALHKLTPEELDFHYFKLHDFDNNTKLDGLEILKAISHTMNHEHGENGGESEGEGSEDNSPLEDLPYFIELIDQVLAEDDKDNDGYLSYMEYVIGRQREEKDQKDQPYHDSATRGLHTHG